MRKQESEGKGKTGKKTCREDSKAHHQRISEQSSCERQTVKETVLSVHVFNFIKNVKWLCGICSVWESRARKSSGLHLIKERQGEKPTHLPHAEAGDKHSNTYGQNLPSTALAQPQYSSPLILRPAQDFLVYFSKSAFTGTLHQLELQKDNNTPTNHGFQQRPSSA